MSDYIYCCAVGWPAVGWIAEAIGGSLSKVKAIFGIQSVREVGVSLDALVELSHQAIEPAKLDEFVWLVPLAWSSWLAGHG